MTLRSVLHLIGSSESDLITRAQILRIDDDHHALDCVDDDNPFEIVSHRNGVLTSVGVTSSRYTMRADIADLRAKARSRTEAEQRQKDAHRSINLDDTRTSLVSLCNMRILTCAHRHISLTRTETRTQEQGGLTGYIDDGT